jgi:hypothetical protein
MEVEKMSDYDKMAIYIRETGYKPITDMENLITMIFAHYKGELEENEKEFCIDDCICFVEESGGFREFDYYC